jgi:hypothetical protein
MRDVVMVSATRTPIGDFGGSLKDVSATSLAMAVIDSSIQRAGIDKKSVEQVIMGNCFEPYCLRCTSLFLSRDCHNPAQYGAVIVFTRSCIV